jgi:hypothetical protein
MDEWLYGRECIDVEPCNVDGKYCVWEGWGEPPPTASLAPPPWVIFREYAAKYDRFVYWFLC